MAKAKETVTTRNKDFNEYDYLYNETTKVKATVNSITATIDDKEEVIIEGVKASDMFFSLEANEDNQNISDLQIGYDIGNDDVTDGVNFINFFNNKTNKYSNSAIVDANGDLYKISVSKSAKATVANTKEDNKTATIGTEKVKNADIHNILFTTNEKGTTITTSTKNDIVTMVQSKEQFDIFEGVVDKIKYTGGVDKYVSKERDTYYTVEKFDGNTSLSIYDNVEGLTKYVYDAETQETKTYDNYVSTNDKLYFGTTQEKFNLFFDVAVDNDKKGYTTDNSELYILNDTNYKSIFAGEDKGFIYMDSFFGYDSTTENGFLFDNNIDFYGNGKIENIYYGTDEESKYDYTSDIIEIASAVANWLSKTDYTTAFEAFEKADSETLAGLIIAYTQHNIEA